MKLFNFLFTSNPQQTLIKDKRKLEQLLYQFSKSEELSDLFLYNKKFRTQSFWQSTENILPQLFQEYSKRKGLPIKKLSEGFQFKSYCFDWSCTEYRYDGYDDYFVGFKYLENNAVNQNEPRLLPTQLIVEIKSGYPGDIYVLCRDRKNQKLFVDTGHKKKESIVDINKYLKYSLELSETSKNNPIRVLLEPSDPKLKDIQQKVELLMRKKAERFLEKKAVQGIPLQDISFHQAMREYADDLRKNLFDDYDLYSFDIKKTHFEGAIYKAQQNIISKYTGT